MNVLTPKFGLGASVLRKEDDAFIRGAGRYTDDETRPGLLHAAVVRSPHAHARFTITDIEAARSAPGVHSVMTHQDVAALGDLPCMASPKQVDGKTLEKRNAPMLAKDTVRHVGDAVAFVVADTAVQARDAAELVAVEWEPLPAVADHRRRAEAEGSALVWDDVDGNLAGQMHVGDADATTSAFDGAAHVTRIDLVQNRLVCNYMEVRSAVGEYDAETAHFTLTSGSQGVHGMRGILANAVFNVDPETIRVVTHDVGGGFGTKGFVYREYALVMEAAQPARPSGQVDFGPRRAFRHRRPWPRQSRHRLDGDGCRGPVPRPQDRHLRQSRRLHLAVRADDPVVRHVDGDRPLRHPGDRRRLQALLHQHRAGGRLSRRRASGGGLSDRAAGRPVRRRHEPCARRDPPAQLHPSRPAALSHRLRPAVRHRRFRRPPRRGHAPLRLADLREPPRGGPLARQAPRHRHGDLCRGLRLSRLRARLCRADAGRARRAEDRHAVERPGPCHRLCAVRRRGAEARLRPHRRAPGRHERDARPAAAPAAPARSRWARSRCAAPARRWRRS